MYLKEAEISNYQSGSQGDQRQVVTEVRSHGDETEKAPKKRGALVIVCAISQAFRLYQGGAEHPAERSASVVWLLCILLWLHSECQGPMNRTGSRSSWRQELTLAAIEQVVTVAWPVGCVPRHALCCPLRASG